MTRTGSSSSGYTYTWKNSGAYYMDNVLPKNIIFENCDFDGNFSNNAISIFGFQDNATVTISNCHFKSVSNVLRISNKTNASNITINLSNCTVDEWEHRENLKEWAGAVLFEDYTSADADTFKSAKRFGKDKVTLNITNLVHSGKKVLPTELKEVVGTKDENQVVLMSCDKYENGSEFIFPYEGYEEYFPTINFK